MAGLPSLTMVLGGAASGKSTFAERTVIETCASKQKIYIATAQPFDDEMRAKIARHQHIRASDGSRPEMEPQDRQWFTAELLAFRTVWNDSVII